MDIYQFNLRHLRAFVKTYELGTLLAAAQAVNITQPALTQGLSRLENQIGATLFLRQPNGMRPAEAAEALYPRAKRALEMIGSSRATHAQLRAFTALARGGSYAEASALSGLARASIHRAVADLEAALGRNLVERRGRGVELTQSGKSFARQAGLARAELAAALEETSFLNNEARGRLAIGAMPLCRARVLPATILSFRRAYPASHLFIAEGSHVELIDPLRDGDLDFLVGALRDPHSVPDLVQVPLFDDQPAIIARADHPLPARKGDLDLAALKEFDWCVPQRGVPLRDRWEAMFEEEGLEAPSVQIECGSVITIRQLLLGTDNLTILSPDQVAVELEAGWLKIVAHAPEGMTRHIGLIHRRDWRPTPLQRAFMKTLSEEVGGLD